MNGGAMVSTNATPDVTTLPLPPKNPLPYRQLLRAVKDFHTGQEVLRDAGGPVVRLRLGPKRLLPLIVVVTSPDGIRDVLARSAAFADRCQVHEVVRHLVGDSLLFLPNEPWLPRRRALQPVFTKHNVQHFGGHMAEAAERAADGWAARGDVDIAVECRRLTMRALGRSVLGLDLTGREDAIGESLRVAATYAADQALRPLRAPQWLPNPTRRRARQAVADIQGLMHDILRDCRADPTREAPLLDALMAAADPETGRPLSDDDICTELMVFLLAGHDTTATLLTYALWALGHHRDIQEGVATEVARIGCRRLVPEDVPRLEYTVQVLHEALRLCPPVVGVARLATRDIAVDGYRVDAGTLVGAGIYAVHRDPALWDRPLQFDPDRFSPQNSTGRDRWQFVPFGGGLRSCIGDHFAMLEATLALATIIRSTEIRSVDRDFPVDVPFTMVAAAPIRARVCPRS